MDALEWAKVFLAVAIYPNLELADTATSRVLGRSPCVTDCKALYDSGISSSCGRGINEKRTAIEVMTVTERMHEFGGLWRWTNTDQQLADGLTKISSRQRFAQVLRRAWHALKFDPSFTAGKKMSLAQKQQYDDELNDAAANQ